MKTANLDKTASVILKYLLHLLGVALFYFCLFYTSTSFWLHQLLEEFTRVPYVSTPNFHEQIYHLLIIYSLFCYFANNFILDLYHKNKLKQLLISIIADMLILPLGILIMIIYNNTVGKHQPALDTSIYNIYVITILLVAKEFIAIKIISKKEGTKQKLSAGARK